MPWKAWKTPASFALGLAAGALLFAALRPADDPAEPPGASLPRATWPIESAQQHSVPTARHDRQISLLKQENDALRKQLAEAQAKATGTPLWQKLPTINEQIADANAILNRRMQAEDERDRQRLLAAGYSASQIEWLINRSRELQKERREAETERRRRGLPVDAAKEMAQYYDRDIELRYEIGDDAYEKYLRALDRPVDIPVRTVSPGSIADAVGIRPGDRIRRYDNKRLFNLGELDGLTRNTTGGSHILEVERDGQLLLFEVPGGHMGILSDIPALRSPR